jgi:hypothetical protein
MKNGNAMQVYSVMGGWDYEGEDGDSLQLFDCKSAAEEYSKSLDGQYDYVKVKVMDVLMHSALTA